MNTSFIRLRFLVAAALLFLAAQRPSLAGSATWNQNPTSGDWNTAANWTPKTVPNATIDIATFGSSNVTDVTNANVIIMLDSLVFSPGAPQYTWVVFVGGTSRLGRLLPFSADRCKVRTPPESAL